MKQKTGKLYIVGTPIGNLQDITYRAVETLRSVSTIFAEDTRHTRKLLSAYDIHKPLYPYHDHSSGKVIEYIISRVRRGDSIAIVSDAGMPGFSDPGYELIKKAIDEKIPISIIPGPSAILTALLLSGLPPYPFSFLGFPPPRGSKRRSFFEKYSDVRSTLVLFEAPHRFHKTLEDIHRYWGNRKLAVTRELTKIHEQVIRGKVEEILSKTPETIKGEITLVVEGAGEDKEHTQDDSWIDELETFIHSKNLSASEAARVFAREHGLSKKMVYKKILELREDKNDTKVNITPD